jgi:hypothetical protein|tara:strand:+ start:270 stop:482 length:213 start_codon:yes stop_codon:yes gene_type:complete
MTNQDNITRLIKKQFTYTTSNNENLRMYQLRGVERSTKEFAVCKVVDVSHDSKTGKKQIFRTLHFSRIKN